MCDLLNSITPQWGRKCYRGVVVLCGFCKGEGKVPLYNDNPAYDGPREQVCQVCMGAGRRRRTVTVEYDLLVKKGK